MSGGQPLLSVSALETAYGPSRVLFGIDLEVRAGEMVGLLGRNGMGKTTLVRSILGLTPATAGSVEFAGRTVHRMAPDRIARLGMAVVPEGRQVFPNLSVHEHLTAFAARRSAAASPWTPQRVYQLFPRLAERRANLGNQLSGGEQQMLAIGRALVTNPRLLILDEATEGLAPLIRVEIYRSIEQLKAAGLSILVIDKDVKALIRIADVHYMLEKGRVVWSGSSAELAASVDVQHRYLGV